MTAYLHLPKTFIRRVLLGRDPYWHQFFWSRWGSLPEEVIAGCRSQKVVWIDAQSGGEVMQSFSFCKHLKRLLPDHVLVFSCNSYDALKAARNISGIDHLIDTPWDIAWVARRVLKQIRPAAVVCIQTPAHPIFLREAKRLKIPTIIVSAFMSADWLRHPTMIRSAALNVFEFIDHVGVKGEPELEGFKAMGVGFKRLEVVGDLKFDFEEFVISNEEQRALQLSLGLEIGSPVLLGGSLNYGEEKILVDAYLKACTSIPALRLILVPRYLDRLGEIEQYIEDRGCCHVRRTDAEQADNGAHPIILIDTFGELAKLYSVATAVFLGDCWPSRRSGGTLVPLFETGYGGNIIQPLMHLKPVFFKEARRWGRITAELEGVWRGLRVNTSDDIARGLVEIVSSPALLEAIREKAAQIVERQRGAAHQNAQFVADAIGW